MITLRVQLLRFSMNMANRKRLPDLLYAEEETTSGFLFNNFLTLEVVA